MGTSFEYGEFVNEPIYPLREQTTLHLHDRDGLGPALTDDLGQSFPDFSYAPGGWTPWMPGPYGQDGLPGRDGKNGLKGLPGKNGKTGAVGPAGKDGGVSAGSILAVFPKGCLRFSPGTTLLQEWSGHAWVTVVFEDTDPGGGQIWESDT